VSANFTTSAIKSCFIFNYLPGQPVRARATAPDSASTLRLGSPPHREPVPTQILQPQQELLNRIGLGMNVAPCRLDVIVPRDVLQRKGVGVFAGDARVKSSV